MNNLPLKSILENANKINELEEKISKIYEAINLNLEMLIENSKSIEKLKEDMVDQLLLLHEKIDKRNDLNDN